MAQQRALPQSKETLLQSYNKRLKDDIKSIMDNFTEIIKTAKIEDETQVSRATQGEQDNYEMHVRAANIVRAGESLMKLVSDLKQFLILNDFPSVNEAIDQRNQQLRALQEECDRKLIGLRDEVSIDLYELEEEYYSSSNSGGIYPPPPPPSPVKTSTSLKDLSGDADEGQITPDLRVDWESHRKRTHHPCPFPHPVPSVSLALRVKTDRPKKDGYGFLSAV
ncbi:mediator of RNA polymerase II transcription subunit 22 isoform X1 [Diceros bicornis minor]|uniref:mediator of RNA polymerase II transcription subunit 22 isoform X1 n=1 Tax=Diceros bicornis minor TaxID=77932 RepID=UPI0026EBB1B0|nr:mediator of RNA polymerase II transcription subunit 22 isoform X1 [Diceros bicornis minor]XP_058380395.1 mediator of RNA polymerase II transcription subunit 22 isoform X1 [Diceros bicornis minor]